MREAVGFLDIIIYEKVKRQTKNPCDRKGW